MAKSKEEHLYDKRYGEHKHHRNNGGGSLIVGKHYQQQDLLNAKPRKFAGDSRNIHSDIRRTKQRLKENSPLIVDNPYN